MLVNTDSDAQFQRYLDRVERALYPEMAGVLATGIRLQVNRNAVQATDYIDARGGALLLRTYRRVYRDQYRAVSHQLREATKADTVSDFLMEQSRFLVGEAFREIRNISESQRKQIAKIVLDMTAEGKSSEKIAREISRQAPEISRPRAATIARTETHNAAIAAVDATLAYKGVTPKTKTWWSAQDTRVRPTHQEAHGQTVPYNQAFTVGGASMMLPGDASHGAGPEEIINCRCAVMFDAN